MRKNTLVSIEEVLSNTNASENIEGARIRASILVGQDLDIQELLGSKLYKFIYNKRTEEGTWTGLTATQTEFVEEYFTPTLMYYSLHRFVKTHWMQISNIGIVKNGSENSEAINNEEADKMSLNYADTANFYATRLKKWICEQKSENNTDEMFTYYSDVDQNLTPTITPDDFPIYFPSRNDCNCSKYNCIC